MLCISNNSTSIICLQTVKWSVLFLTIQFNASHLFAHSLSVEQFYLTHTILSGATTPGWSGPGSNGNEGALHIPQSSKTGASPSDCLMSYPGHLLGWVDVLLLSRDAVSVFYSSSLPDSWFGFCLMTYQHFLGYLILNWWDDRHLQ